MTTHDFNALNCASFDRIGYSMWCTIFADNFLNPEHAKY